ncbi:MAG: hypothetical protein HYY76_02570 [Acidobacteria bacterium]|nr:hypothetical protein [Acidobacteriota bacterium]
MIVSLTGSASGQGWTEFVSREDGFRVVFPGPPRVTETTYKSEYGADLPARVYSVERGAERYSRTFAAIHMHEHRLHILEATVPEGAPEPGIFQQSMGFVDRDGNGIRYQSVYSNIFPAPPRTRGGQGGAGAATPAEAGR